MADTFTQTKDCMISFQDEEGNEVYVSFVRITTFIRDYWGEDADGRRGVKRVFVEEDRVEDVMVSEEQLGDYYLLKAGRERVMEEIEKYIVEHPAEINRELAPDPWGEGGEDR